MKTGLYRSVRNKKIGGVCAGLAEYFDVDIALVRIAFVVGVVLHGIGLLGYIILWIAIPENPNETWNPAYSGLGSVGSSAAATTGNMYSQSSSPRRRRGALFAGVALIVAGFYFLLVNLLPWFDFENYSPVLLIVVGILVLSYAFIDRPQQYSTAGTTASAFSTENSYTTKSAFTTTDANAEMNNFSEGSRSSFGANVAGGAEVSQTDNSTANSTSVSTPDTPHTTEHSDEHEHLGGVS